MIENCRKGQRKEEEEKEERGEATDRQRKEKCMKRLYQESERLKDEKREERKRNKGHCLRSCLGWKGGMKERRKT